MAEVKILCWNVNGIRAVRGRGFLEWLYKESPDILCLQETKAHPEQLEKSCVSHKDITHTGITRKEKAIVVLPHSPRCQFCRTPDKPC